MIKKSVLLVGASGLIGTACLKQLAASDQFGRIQLLGRRKLSDLPDDPRIDQRIIDFDNLRQFREFINGDIVICMLGSTIKKAGSKAAFYKVDVTYPIGIATIAAENGASQLLVVSSMGADPQSRIFYSRAKGEMEAAIQQLPFDSIGIFRPSLLTGERSEFRLREEIAKIFGNLFSFLIPLKYKPVHADTVARSMLYTALKQQPGAHILESDQIQLLGKLTTERN